MVKDQDRALTCPAAKIDEDEVTAEYDVFITPSLAEQIYLLQFPIRSRDQPYNERNASKPVEMRMKPDSGFLEMDIDMSTHTNFNKRQGLVWGEAMRKAQASGVSTFGAAAGFGPGTVRSARPGRGGEGENSLDENLNRFKNAVDKNYVFHKQTLGGQILREEDGAPNYMLGSFRGKELHLTRVDGIVQMRPQFHHVDAVTHVEKGGTAREAEDARPPPQARGLVQSYKDNRDTEDPSAAKAKNLMQLALEEPWTKIQYHDEDEIESYDAYHTKLFVQDAGNAAKLKSSMSNEEYLDAISAPRNDPSGRRKKKPLTRKQRTAIELGDDDVELHEEV